MENRLIYRSKGPDSTGSDRGPEGRSGEKRKGVFRRSVEQRTQVDAEAVLTTVDPQVDTDSDLTAVDHRTDTDNVIDLTAVDPEIASQINAKFKEILSYLQDKMGFRLGEGYSFGKMYGTKLSPGRVNQLKKTEFGQMFISWLLASMQASHEGHGAPYQIVKGHFGFTLVASKEQKKYGFSDQPFDMRGFNKDLKYQEIVEAPEAPEGTVEEVVDPEVEEVVRKLRAVSEETEEEAAERRRVEKEEIERKLKAEREEAKRLEEERERSVAEALQQFEATPRIKHLASKVEEEKRVLDEGEVKTLTDIAMDFAENTPALEDALPFAEDFPALLSFVQEQISNGANGDTIGALIMGDENFGPKFAGFMGLDMSEETPQTAAAYNAMSKALETIFNSLFLENGIDLSTPHGG